jgi:trimethylamine--corrinoid protein Co-methyltransferase
LVEESIRRAGKKYILYGRDRARMARFGYGDYVFPSTESQAFVVEDNGAVRRPGTSRDVRDAVKIGDALEHIDWLGGFILPDDLPASIRDVFMTAELVKGSAKPQHVFMDNVRTFRYALEICEIVSGGKEQHRGYPMLSAFVEPISPLRYARNGLDILKTCVQEGLPVYFGPMVQAGVTGPATLAGTCALENAEVLSAIVIAQAFAPGCALGFGCSCHTADMRTMMISFGAPEQAVLGVAMTQMCRHYGFPSLFNTGLSDSKTMDAQYGLEKGMTMLAGALAGLETCAPMGICGADQGASFEQLIIDNALIGYVKRILRGLEVNKETLALDVVRNVGRGGTFITEDHTMAHFRDEVDVIDGFDRRNWERWQADGGKSMYDWAHEKRKEILAGHCPEPIDARLAQEIDTVVAAAKVELERAETAAG